MFDKLGMVVHICNSNNQAMDAGGSDVQGHPWLHSELQVNLGLGIHKTLSKKKKRCKMQR